MDAIKLKFFYDSTFMWIPLNPVPTGQGSRAELKLASIRLYSDKRYKLRTEGENGKIDKLYINDDPQPPELLWSNDPQPFFRDCFGAIVITAFVGKTQYVSDRIPIMVPSGIANQSLLKMMDYVSEHSGEGLFGKHGLPTGDTRRRSAGNISIDEKLRLVQRVDDTLTRCMVPLQSQTAQRGAFYARRGMDLSPDGLRYLVSRPGMLAPVEIPTGICVGGTFYAPVQTARPVVQTASASNYEGLAVTGFIAAVLEELEDIRRQLTGLAEMFPRQHEENGYIETSYFVYNKNSALAQRYVQVIDDHIHHFRTLYDAYRGFLPDNGFPLEAMPMYTSVFAENALYRAVYADMAEWFVSGRCDVTRSQLFMDFVTLSRIYEYYCLVRLLRALGDVGFRLEESFRFTYDLSGFYFETACNNTFRFSHDADADLGATVYFQPVISGRRDAPGAHNGIGLIRSTSKSIDAGDSALSLRHFGSYYTPDFMLKLTCGGKRYYIIFDAKLSTKFDVMQYQLPVLIFKYLFSLRGGTRRDILAGLCLMCGKERANSVTDLHDLAADLDVVSLPGTQVVSLGVTNIDRDKTLSRLLKDYITLIKTQEECEHASN